MFNKVFTLFFLATTSLFAAPLDYSSPPPSLQISNRVLLKINGKHISVMDVVRKMDLLLFRRFPDLVLTPETRYQFYLSSWKTILASVIDDQLIMADAEEKQVEITEGEIREELEALFGPDVVINIDKLGMTLDEATELLKTEILVRRMNGMMVRSKAMADLTPTEVRKRYEAHLVQHPPHAEWVYQVLSVRGEDLEEVEKVATVAHRLLSENVPLADVIAQLESEKITVHLSEEYSRKEADLAAAHKSILEGLTAGQYSAPQIRKGQGQIFFLKEQKLVGETALSALEDKIKEELITASMEKYGTAYHEQLRKRWSVSKGYLDALLPESFVPFALR